MNNNDFLKFVEKNKQEIARILRPYMNTRIVKDIDSGQEREVREKMQIITLTGTENIYTVPEVDKFSKIDSVMITLNADTTVVLKAVMLSGTTYKVTAASEVTGLKIKVTLRGY